MRIGIDIMGGDYAPDTTVRGSILAQSELPDSVEIVMLGDEKIIRDHADKNELDISGFELVHCSETIAMGDHPTKALRGKKDSGIAKGFRLLKTGGLDAFSSVGNSGAMMVGAMYSVKTIAGVIRPSITSILPKENGGVGIILDVGINADCRPDVLYQFGILGSLFAEHVYSIPNPKVGLLNIGEEDEKGNLLTKSAFEIMNDTTDYNFIGNVEGRDLFEDHVDVVVCDGFTGNVVLKQAEAFYTLVKRRKIEDEFFDRFNYELYGGTPVLGINSNVIIGHGISSPAAIKSMILLCKDVVDAGLPERINEAFK